MAVDIFNLVGVQGGTTRPSLAIHLVTSGGTTRPPTSHHRTVDARVFDFVLDSVSDSE